MPPPAHRPVLVIEINRNKPRTVIREEHLLAQTGQTRKIAMPWSVFATTPYNHIRRGVSVWETAA